MEIQFSTQTLTLAHSAKIEDFGGGDTKIWTCVCGMQMITPNIDKALDAVNEHLSRA